MAEYHSNVIQAITCDANRVLVMAALEGIPIILQRCASFIRANFSDFKKDLEQLSKIVLEIFQSNIYCQIENKDQDNDEEENLAEYDYMLKEYAGDIVPALALCLPSDCFNTFFEQVCVFLIKILNKSESTSAEKSFSIGIVGETLTNMETLNGDSAQKLFVEFYKHIFSTDNEIKSNTIFTLGMLCAQASNNCLQQYYLQIINDVLEILKHEKSKQTLDNICGTLCRMFLACMSVNLQEVNYDLILSTIFELTPLKTDYNEYMTLFTFVSKIIDNNNVSLLEN